MRAAPPSRDGLGAFLLFGIFALVLAIPALASATPVFLGHPDSDLYKHVWGHWLVATWIRDYGQWPVFTCLQNFPFGGTLFIIDPFNAAVHTLLSRWVPTHVLFNLLVVAQLALGGWGAWRLALYVTDDAAASLVAGAAYAFSPWVLGYTVSSGVSETLGLAWIPLSVLGVLRLMAHRSWRTVIGTALALIMAGLNTWYYLLFSFALGGTLVVLALFLGREGTWLPRLSWRFLGQALLAAALACACLWPLAHCFLASFADETSLEPSLNQREELTTSLKGQDDFFTASDFVLPGKDRLQVNGVIDRLAQTPYVGLLVLSLALLGVVRGDSRAVVWTAMACGFALLSLGPAVRFTHHWQEARLDNLLYVATFHMLGFWLVSAPFRIHVLTMLCLGMAAAVGLSRLRPHQPVVGSLMACLVLAEVTFLSPTPAPIPVAPAQSSAVYAGLHLDQTVGVLDLPPLVYETELTPGRYYGSQTVHEGGTPYTTGGVFSRRLQRNGCFLEMWRLARGIWPPGEDPLEFGSGLADLSVMGYRYVVLHGDLLPPRAFRHAYRQLKLWLGPPTRVDGAILRFDLGKDDRGGRQPTSMEPDQGGRKATDAKPNQSTSSAQGDRGPEAHS